MKWQPKTNIREIPYGAALKSGGYHVDAQRIEFLLALGLARPYTELTLRDPLWTHWQLLSNGLIIGLSDRHETEWRLPENRGAGGGSDFANPNSP